MVPNVTSGTNPQESRLILGTGQSLGDTRRLGTSHDPDIQRPNMRIMRVNRQVYHEISEVAIRDTIKRFTCLRGHHIGPRVPAHVIFWVARKSPPDSLFLRHIQLEMTAAQYFAFICIVPSAGRPFNWAPNGYISIPTLKDFKNLTTLDFRFISPKHLSAACPFASIYSEVTPHLEHSCQKKWIDLFFTLAFAALRKLIIAKSIKVTTSGCIKTSSKLYWEHVLNDHHVDHIADMKTAAKRARKQKKGNDRPLKCECSYPCAGDLTQGRTLFAYEEWMVRRIEGLKAEREGV